MRAGAVVEHLLSSDAEESDFISRVIPVHDHGKDHSAGRTPEVIRGAQSYLHFTGLAQRLTTCEARRARRHDQKCTPAAPYARHGVHGFPQMRWRQGLLLETVTMRRWLIEKV